MLCVKMQSIQYTKTNYLHLYNTLIFPQTMFFFFKTIPVKLRNNVIFFKYILIIVGIELNVRKNLEKG